MSGSESTVKCVANTYNNQGPVNNVPEARDIFNNSTFISNINNVPPETKLGAIIFRYRPPVEDFIGRETELNFLREKLCIENPRAMVVSGLGGIGKTQLVKKFIEENKTFYRNIIWINSQESGSIEEEFKILAENDLGISANANGKERDFRSMLGIIFNKLSTSKTLLVFDNVDKVDIAETALDIVAPDVKPHILITSRIQEFSESVNFKKLEVFSPEETLEYISKKLGSEDDDESLEDKVALAETLNNLPIALRQATAHIKYQRKRDENYKICDYINDYNKYREQVLSSDLFQDDIFNQYKETTLTTWKITMNAISECQPHGELALRILQIIAYFDNVDIIPEIFFNLKGLSSDPELNKREVISAVGLIINFSMVDDYNYQSVLSIHKLVQEVIKIQLENDKMAESTLRDCLQLITQMEKNEKFKVCLEHGISVYLPALKFSKLVIEFDKYPSMILRNLHQSGKYIRAFSFGTEVNERFANILGKDHRRTLLFKYEIANSYSKLGRYSEALQMYKDIFDKEKMILGDDHPDTILTKYAIADSYSNLGKYSDALQMFEDIFDKQKLVLGDDHPHTILTKFRIADSYRYLGKYSDALEMFEDIFDKLKLVLGDDHPHTILTKFAIAYSYRNLGKYSDAQQMFEDIFDKQKLVLGDDHPHTILTKFRIADSYSYLGKYSDALEMFEDIFDKLKIVLGDDHPHTIITKSRIADSYSKLGKYSDALQMYEDIFDKLKIVLGDDHPDTILTKFRIADSYNKLGKYSDALQMYEDIFDKLKIVLGDDHPHTIITKSRIADSYSKLSVFSRHFKFFKRFWRN